MGRCVRESECCFTSGEACQDLKRKFADLNTRTKQKANSLFREARKTGEKWGGEIGYIRTIVMFFYKERKYLRYLFNLNFSQYKIYTG
jgi:hypothetical protein